MKKIGRCAGKQPPNAFRSFWICFHAGARYTDTYVFLYILIFILITAYHHHHHYLFVLVSVLVPVPVPLPLLLFLYLHLNPEVKVHLRVQNTQRICSVCGLNVLLLDALCIKMH